MNQWRSEMEQSACAWPPSTNNTMPTEPCPQRAVFRKSDETVDFVRQLTLSICLSKSLLAS
jgi:hypothetical protein